MCNVVRTCGDVDVSWVGWSDCTESKEDMVGCFNKFLAQSLAQNKATLMAIESMKKIGKAETDTSFNWLLTYASVDIIALFRTMITELLPGVRARVHYACC